jgi:aspartate aminotransferase
MQALADKLDQIASIQANSMIGALRLVGAFLSRNPVEQSGRSVYLPNPMNEDDVTALRDSGLDIRYYRFLDRKNGGVDIEGMRADLMVSLRVRLKARR